jgi:transcriptional regulator with XRE-family HTH domain
MIKYIIKSPLLVALGNRIKMIRMSKGMNQNQLALNCNMEKSSMSKIESGSVNLSYLTMNRISAGLEISMKALCAD